MYFIKGNKREDRKNQYGQFNRCERLVTTRGPGFHVIHAISNLHGDNYMSTYHVPLLHAYSHVLCVARCAGKQQKSDSWNRVSVTYFPSQRFSLSFYLSLPPPLTLSLSLYPFLPPSLNSFFPSLPPSLSPSFSLSVSLFSL